MSFIDRAIECDSQKHRYVQVASRRRDQYQNLTNKQGVRMRIGRAGPYIHVVCHSAGIVFWLSYFCFHTSASDEHLGQSWVSGIYWIHNGQRSIKQVRAYRINNSDTNKLNTD